MDPSSQPREKPRTGRSKVKSGCRTCKIRRIKCDEGRPVCQRCLSTGRVCDGYGIWGGGGNAYGQRSIVTKLLEYDRGVATKPCSSLSHFPFKTTNTKEQSCLEWFIHRTSIKIPGAFPSDFWTTLVIQASSSEPAVLHAVLALTTAHKADANNDSNLEQRENILDDQEQFVLRQYSKAISHLQPHFSTRTQASVRVALITCVIFIYLEFLRGNYRTAKTHYQNGTKLLEDIVPRSSTVDDGGNVVLENYRETVDDWVIETFAKLQVQVELFGQGFQNVNPALQVSGAEHFPLEFQSLNQARQQLDRLLHRISLLTEVCRQGGTAQDVDQYFELLETQQRILADLSSWLGTYTASIANLQAKLTLRDFFPYRLLRWFHTMAVIMANTCLCLESESIYDSHLASFMSVIAQSIELRKIALPDPTTDILGLPRHGMSLSVADIGSIPPLYYTALKCRNHRIRLQAIRLLSTLAHKEGIWDSTLAACVAREVMELEEKDFYKDICASDDFPLFSIPEEKDLLLPPVPESYRVSDVRVGLPDDATGKIVLMCRRKKDDGSWEVLVREYDVSSRCWKDG